MRKERRKDALVVDESTVNHVGVGEVHGDREAALEGRLSRPSKRLKAIDEIDLVGIGREREGLPGDLRRTDVDFRVDREEARFELRERKGEEESADVASHACERGGRSRTSSLSCMRVKPWCATEGLMRYSHSLWFRFLGATNAVAVSCSA